MVRNVSPIITHLYSIHMTGMIPGGGGGGVVAYRFDRDVPPRVSQNYMLLPKHNRFH